ncbi:MAG: energy-coupling factor transporter transmembrane component T family protein [Anaerolineales bacterium]
MRSTTMASAFSLFAARESGLHRLHPLTKLGLAGFLLVAGLALPGLGATYATFGLIVIPLAAWGRVLRELIRATWKVVLPFAVSVFLIQGFLWTGGTPLIGLGPISLKREGLLFAIASTGRILMVVSSFILFALTTRPDALMISLTQHGFPGSLAYIVVATIQIVPRFQAKAAAILDAQRARGLETEGSLVRRARAVLPLVAPLILSSLIDVEERALAIEARAFNHPGPKTSLVEIHETRWEPIAHWGFVLGMIAVIGVRIIWWLGG